MNTNVTLEIRVNVEETCATPTFWYFSHHPNTSWQGQETSTCSQTLDQAHQNLRGGKNLLSTRQVYHTHIFSSRYPGLLNVDKTQWESDHNAVTHCEDY